MTPHGATPRRRWAFRLLLAALVAPLAAAAALLAWLAWETRWAAARPSDRDATEFVRDGGDWVSVHPRMLHQRFAAEKPRGAFRAFVLGGSQAMGVPYAAVAPSRRLGPGLNEGGIPTWLRHTLSAVLPGRSVEVVNAAKHARDLRDNLDTFRWVLRNGAPDLVVVLSGDNERWAAMDGIETPEEGVRLRRGARLRPVLDRLTAAYRESARALVSEAETAGVDVMFLTVPDNVRDWFPAGPEDFDLDAVLGALEASRWEEALSRLDREPRPENPLWIFCRAKALDRSGRPEDARSLYARARDLDESFLRCRSEWNDVVRGLRGGTLRVLDLERLMEARAADGLPGFDLFHDYCHLRLEENRYAAKAVAAEYALWKGLPAGGLDGLELPDVLGRKRWVLYGLKAVQWARLKYYSRSVKSRDVNTRAVIEGYRKSMAEADRLLRTTYGRPSGEAAGPGLGGASRASPVFRRQGGAEPERGLRLPPER
jgi:hypothetical protein